MTAPDTLRENVAGAGAGDDVSRQVEEVEITVSDMHLGEGAFVRVSRRRSLAARAVAWVRRGFRSTLARDLVEIRNPLEDFPFDAEFSAFLSTMAEKYREADVIRLRLMGDVFDPLAVSVYGRFVEPPYEVMGVYKMRKIIHGHPAYFDALAAFLRLPNARLDVFAGNHDLFLVWPGVRETILRRVAGGDPALRAKVRFIDQDAKFEDAHRGVLYYHGMNAEPHNSVDPAACIMTHRFGVKLKRPVLNMPYGSYMTVGLVNRLKMRNRLVGRMREDREIWTHAVRFKWGWGLYAGIVLLWHFIYSQFFAFWDIRRKTNWRNTLAIVLSTTTKNPVDKYAAKLLKEREGVRVVVMGHSHNWRRVSSEDGTYLNTGSWALTYRLEDPKFVRRWERCKKLETAWRTVQHFFRTGELPFFAQLRKALVFLAAVSAMIAFLVVSIPRDPGLAFWSVHLQDLKLPIGVLLAFVIVGGLFRLFAARPRTVDDSKFTFGLVRHFRNGDLKAEIMEYHPRENAVRECV